MVQLVWALWLAKLGWEELDDGRKLTSYGDLSALVVAQVATLFNERELSSVLALADVFPILGDSHKVK